MDHRARLCLHAGAARPPHRQRTGAPEVARRRSRALTPVLQKNAGWRAPSTPHRRELEQVMHVVEVNSRPHKYLVRHVNTRCRRQVPLEMRGFLDRLIGSLATAEGIALLRVIGESETHTANTRVEFGLKALR